MGGTCRIKRVRAVPKNIWSKTGASYFVRQSVSDTFLLKGFFCWDGNGTLQGSFSGEYCPVLLLSIFFHGASNCMICYFCNRLPHSNAAFLSEQTFFNDWEPVQVSGSCNEVRPEKGEKGVVRMSTELLNIMV